MKAFIIVLAAFIAAGIAARRRDPEGQHDRRTLRQRSDLDGIAPHIERASYLIEQLRELDDLITSADVCAPRERAQALQLEWTNHNGSRHAARVWMDGTDSTAAVKAAATTERALLFSSLLREIEAAYMDGVTTETDGQDAAGRGFDSATLCGGAAQGSRSGRSCGSPSHSVTLSGEGVSVDA